MLIKFFVINIILVRVIAFIIEVFLSKKIIFVFMEGIEMFKF